MWPMMARRVFAPSAVTESFRTYPAWMSLRPLSLRAEAAEMVIGIAAAARLKNEYRDIAVPVVIMAGTDDHFIDSGWNSVRLHRELPGSELTLAPGAGHMVHHIVPEEVMAAIDAAAAAPMTLSDSTPVRAVAARMAQEAAGA
jgi:pimeloyl-ACP methyl ester carboxylesterase